MVTRLLICLNRTSTQKREERKGRKKDPHFDESFALISPALPMRYLMAKAACNPRLSSLASLLFFAPFALFALSR
jgi:hypothetical protein